MLYYTLSAFLVSTLIFIMNKLPILTIEWAVCIALGVLVMAMIDKAFGEDEHEDF